MPLLEGTVDLIVQRFIDAIQSIPGLILALVMVVVLGPSTTTAITTSPSSISAQARRAGAVHNGGAGHM